MMALRVETPHLVRLLRPTVVEVGPGVKALLRPLSEVPVVAKDQKGVQLPYQAATVLVLAVQVVRQLASTL